MPAVVDVQARQLLIGTLERAAATVAEAHLQLRTNRTNEARQLLTSALHQLHSAQAAARYCTGKDDE